MTDPYEILGIPRNATEEQLKEAYRSLARKYNNDENRHKMQEINDAYDTIIAELKGGTKATSDFYDIRSLIESKRLEEAQELLDGVPMAERTAEWYFLNGTVLYKRGWFNDAYTSFSTACRMDPDNVEYRQAYNKIANNRRGNPFRSDGVNIDNCSCCDMCACLYCTNLCCDCMGGGRGC